MAGLKDHHSCKICQDDLRSVHLSLEKEIKQMRTQILKEGEGEPEGLQRGGDLIYLLWSGSWCPALG